MVRITRISLVIISYNINILLMMIIFVVRSIFCFVRYYIDADVSNRNFKLLKLLFLGLIIFMLSSTRLVIFIG